MINATIILKDGRKMNLELYEDIAPISVANFVELAKSGFYKGLIFHRVIEGFMIQGGGFNIELKQKEGAKTIKGEFEFNGVANSLKHTKGVLSMARTMVMDSASSQFFICVADVPHLDGQYAAFGKTADDSSLQVAMDIAKVNTGNAGYFSDVPTVPIVIEDIVIK